MEVATGRLYLSTWRIQDARPRSKSNLFAVICNSNFNAGFVLNVLSKCCSLSARRVSFSIFPELQVQVQVDFFRTPCSMFHVVPTTAEWLILQLQRKRSDAQQDWNYWPLTAAVWIGYCYCTDVEYLGGCSHDVTSFHYAIPLMTWLL